LRLDQFKFRTALLATAAGSIIGYVLLGGASLASATVRHRSGAVHQHQLADLAGHPSGMVMTGTDVMGVVVLLMAVIAALFLVTTFIRRRVTVPVATS
jgi:hypothetical protein